MSNKSGNNERKYSSVPQQAQQEKAKIIREYKSGLINTDMFVKQVRQFDKRYEQYERNNEIKSLIFSERESQNLIKERLRADLVAAKREHENPLDENTDDSFTMEAVIREHLRISTEYLNARSASEVSLKSSDFHALGLDEAKTMKKIEAENNREIESSQEFSGDTESSELASDSDLDSPRGAEPVSPNTTTRKKEDIATQELASEPSQSSMETSASTKKPLRPPQGKAPTPPAKRQSPSSTESSSLSFEDVTGIEPDLPRKTVPQSLKATSVSTKKTLRQPEGQAPAPPTMRQSPSSTKSSPLSSEPITGVEPNLPERETPPTKQITIGTKRAHLQQWTQGNRTETSERQKIDQQEPSQQTITDYKDSLVNALLAAKQLSPSKAVSKAIDTAMTNLWNIKTDDVDTVKAETYKAVSTVVGATTTNVVLKKILTAKDEKFLVDLMKSPEMEKVLEHRHGRNAFLDAAQNKLPPEKRDIIMTQTKQAENRSENSQNVQRASQGGK